MCCARARMVRPCAVLVCALSYSCCAYFVILSCDCISALCVDNISASLHGQKYFLRPQAVIDVLEIIWFLVWILRRLQVDVVEQ